MAVQDSPIDRAIRLYDFAAMGQQSRGVVSGAGGYNTGINRQPNEAASIPPTTNVDRSAISVGPSARSPQNANVAFPNAPAFNLAGPSPNVQMPENATGGIASGTSQPTTTGSATNVAAARTAVQTPYGTIWATADQAKNFGANTARVQQEATAESQRQQKFDTALARAQDIGRQNTAAAQAQSNQRYAGFRKDLALGAMNSALDPERLGGVGRGATFRAGQAMVEAARWSGAAAGGAMPKIGGDVQTPYGTFTQGSMGQFSPLRNQSAPFGRMIDLTPRQAGGPQPAKPIQVPMQPAYNPSSLMPQFAPPSVVPQANFSLTGFPAPALYNFPKTNRS